VKSYVSPGNALQVLKNFSLFSGFTDSELLGLYPGLQPVFRKYNKDNIIIEEGDKADKIGLVVNGRIVARKMTRSGRIHILAVHEPGDDFGFDAAFSTYGTSPLTFTAETDCTVLFVLTSCFFEAGSSTGIRILCNANRIMADKCIRLLYKTDILSKKSLRERIFTYFLIMQNKNQHETFRLKMSREQFAQYLCVNRSALSRELGRMQREGLIELRPDGRVTIKYDGTGRRPEREQAPQHSQADGGARRAARRLSRLPGVPGVCFAMQLWRR
jgi:CRP-like cAMP-binding protein